MTPHARTAALAALCLALAACGGDDPEPVATTEEAAPTTDAEPRSGTLSSSTSPSTSSSPATTETVHPRKPSSTTTTSGPPRGGLVSPKKVKDTDAGEVADAYVRSVFTFDTRSDASLEDAQRRATRWMAPDLAAPLSDEGGAAPSDANGWQRLAGDDTWTKVSTKDVSAADPTKGVATERLLEVTITTNTKGKPAKEKTTVSLTLERASESEPWRVSQMQTY